MNEKTDDVVKNEPVQGVKKKSQFSISPIFLVVAIVGTVALFFLGKQIMFMKMLGDEKSRVDAPVVIDENRPKPQGKATLTLPGGQEVESP